MKTRITAVSALFCTAAAVSADVFGSVSVAADITLAKDMDWRGKGAVALASGATVNLNGHRLYVDGLAGEGTVVSASLGTGVADMDGCTLLSYVESPSGNNTVQCRIDTGYVPASTDRAEAGFRTASTTLQWIFGAYTADKRFDCYVNSGNLYFHLGGQNGYMGAAENYHNVVLDGKHSCALVRKEYVKPQTVSITSSIFTPDGTIKLFGPGDDSTDRYASSCRMYFFRIYDQDGNMKVNMLPAQDASGVVGFYDTVRKRFFRPGNGALTAGDSNGYAELEYVETPAENSGSFVDTRYWASIDDRVETRIRFGSVSGYMGIFSARGKHDNRTFNCMLRDSAGISFEHYLSGSAYAYHTVDGVKTAYEAGSDYDISMDGGSRVFSVNGTPSETSLGNDLDVVQTNFVLFATVDRDSGSAGNFAKQLRMYGFRVYDANGYMTVDLVPARRTADNAGGFYDRVRNCFLTTPAGAAALGVGSFVEQLADLTTSGGRCWASRAAEGNTVVGNLFSNNFAYAATPSNRFYVGEASLPLSIDYDFGEGNQKAVNMYRIWGGGLNRSPVKWSFWGSNDDAAYSAENEDAWTLLDSQSEESDWSEGECRTKVFSNESAYRYYRFKAEEKGSASYFDLTQLEYFHVGATPRPGELHVEVASGTATTNATVRLGGNMKVVVDGDGTFFQCVSNQFYTGGTVVREGEFVVGAPLSTALTMADGATLGFWFARRDAAPLLKLEDGTSIGSSLDVTVYRGGDFTLPGDGTVLTYGYDFSGTAINFSQSEWARRVRVGVGGDLMAFGPSGLLIIFR